MQYYLISISVITYPHKPCMIPEIPWKGLHATKDHMSSLTKSRWNALMSKSLFKKSKSNPPHQQQVEQHPGGVALVDHLTPWPPHYEAVLVVAIVNTLGRTMPSEQILVWLSSSTKIIIMHGNLVAAATICIASELVRQVQKKKIHAHPHTST